MRQKTNESLIYSKNFRWAEKFRGLQLQ